MTSFSLLKFWFKSEVKGMDDLNKTDIMKAMKLLESNWNYKESFLQKQKHFQFASTVILRQYWYREYCYYTENCFTFSNILLQRHCIFTFVNCMLVKTVSMKLHNNANDPVWPFLWQAQQWFSYIGWEVKKAELFQKQAFTNVPLMLNSGGTLLAEQSRNTTTTYHIIILFPLHRYSFNFYSTIRSQQWPL